MIAFRVSEHYWLISLLGGYVITAFAPIALLAWAIVIYHFIGRGSRPGGYALRVAWTALFLYVSTASVSTFVHEPTLDTTMTQLAYIWSPVLIFVSLLWLPALNTDKAVRDCTRALVLSGLIFSLYTIYTYTGLYDYTIVPETLQTNLGERQYDTSHRAGVGSVEATRWTVPGINTSHFAPMLLPLVFLGMLMARQGKGVARFAYPVVTAVLAATIVGSLSRGAMIPLIIGLMYLSYVRWYGWFGTLIAGAGLVVLLGFQPIMLGRILLTIGAVIPVPETVAPLVGNVKVLAPLMDGRIEYEQHFLAVPYTVDMILAKPVLGHGLTGFTDEQSAALSDIGGKVHNNYLSIGAAFGVPAVVFYLCFIVGIGVGLRKVIHATIRGSEPWQTAHIWGAILIAYAFYLVGAPAEFHFVWLWFGLMAAWVRNQLLKKKKVLSLVGVLS